MFKEFIIEFKVESMYCMYSIVNVYYTVYRDEVGGAIIGVVKHNMICQLVTTFWKEKDHTN